MNKYEIWLEGYQNMYEMYTAKWMGVFHGNSFQEVCDQLFYNNPKYNSEKLTYRGVRLFDNEEDARRNFG